MSMQASKRERTFHNTLLVAIPCFAFLQSSGPWITDELSKGGAASSLILHLLSNPPFSMRWGKFGPRKHLLFFCDIGFCRSRKAGFAISRTWRKSLLLWKMRRELSDRPIDGTRR